MMDLMFDSMRMTSRPSTGTIGHVDPNVAAKFADHDRRIGDVERELRDRQQNLSESERRMEERITQKLTKANEILVARLDEQDARAAEDRRHTQEWQSAQEKQSARVEGMISGATSTLKIIAGLLTLACALAGAYTAIMALRGH